MDLPKRKPIRLPDYNYSSPGAYFITICTHDRQCIIHLILRIDNGPPRASAPTVSDAVGALKRLVNRRLGHNIWQRSFHEHVIRNEHDYREIWEYIDQNPAKWAEDRYYD